MANFHTIINNQMMVWKYAFSVSNLVCCLYNTIWDLPNVNTYVTDFTRSVDMFLALANITQINRLYKKHGYSLQSANNRHIHIIIMIPALSERQVHSWQCKKVCAFLAMQ